MQAQRKNTKQIERRSVTSLKVPNTPEGQAFLEQLKKFKTAGTRLRIRGRGPRAAQAVADGRIRRGYDQDLPLSKSTSFAIAVCKQNFSLQDRKRADEFWKVSNEVCNLRYQNSKLQAEVVELQTQVLHLSDVIRAQDLRAAQQQFPVDQKRTVVIKIEIDPTVN